MPHRGVLRAAAIFGALWLVALSAPPTEARTLTGTGGADRLTGTTRADVISGKGGADRLFGRKGADRLLGGEGLDRLSGGAGVDILNGGPGRDILDCGPGRDRAAADRRDTVRRNCESVSGRGGGGSQPPQQQPPQQQPPPPPTVQGDFTGTLTTTVRYVHVCTGQVVAEQTTQIPSRVTIRPPLQPIPTDLPATLPEANPINLILGQTDVAGTTAPGSVNIASGARFRFSAIRSLILRYWNLTLNGTTLTGTLTEDNREQGAAFNLLAAWQELAPCFPQHGSFVNQLAIAEGATLTGTVTPQSVQLRITGNTIDTFHPFVAEITAARSG